MAPRIILAGTKETKDEQPLIPVSGAGKYDYFLKLKLLGDSGVGKSSLLRRFADGTYEDGYLSTIGLDLKIKTFEYQGKVVKAQIWDTAGQERLRGMAIGARADRDHHAYLLCCDVTNEVSFNNVFQWLKDMPSDTVPVVLVATKVDLHEKRVVASIDAEELARAIEIRSGRKVAYVETSTKENINVDAAFSTAAELCLDEKLRETIVDSEAQGEVVDDHTRSTAVELDLNERLGETIVDSEAEGEVVDERTQIIQRLDAYIERIESHTLNSNTNFWHGFLFFVGSQGENREANYYLAKKLKTELEESTTKLKEIFDDRNIAGLRDEAIDENNLYTPSCRPHKINSKVLNSIIKDVQEAEGTEEESRSILGRE